MTQTYTDEKERWQRLHMDGSVPEGVASAARSISGDKAAKTWEDYVRREAFAYDPEKDPLYANYARLYTRLGQQAMEDTVGKAAALTGGYDNSYAQIAGQQEYERYLQQLSAVMPELYDRAYDRYQAEGEALYNQILLQNRQQEQQAQQQEAAFERLMGLMEMGYGPTDDELAAAGMTRAQADSILAYYTAPVYTGKASGDTKEEVEPTKETQPEDTKPEATYANAVKLALQHGVNHLVVMTRADWFREHRLNPTDPLLGSRTYEEYLQALMNNIPNMKKKKKS